MKTATNFSTWLLLFLGVVSCLPATLALAQETLTPAPPVTNKLMQTKEEISAKEKEIAELDQQIKNLKSKRDVTASEAQIIAVQVQQLDQQLNKAQLELRATQLTIGEVEEEQKANKETMATLRVEVETKRQHLQELVRALYYREQNSIVKLFFSTWSFSDVLAERSAYQQLQEQTVQLVQELRQREEELDRRQSDLAEQEQDLGQLEDLLVNQKQGISRQQQERSQFLQAKKSEQVEYEQLIAQAQAARQEIEQDIFTLRSAGIEVSLNTALDMAKYAASLTGVKASLLLAVLKVESDLGNNIGSGKFPDDMHPDSREPFLRLTKKLGLDPNTAKISRRPASGRGWGGAIGPAQIMPATWEGIEGRLLQLTGKPTVNPYDLTDAFVATAVFLADRGAANPAAEREAVGRYIAGPNWQYYGWYIDKVMAVAKEYDKVP